MDRSSPLKNPDAASNPFWSRFRGTTTRWSCSGNASSPPAKSHGSPMTECPTAIPARPGPRTRGLRFYWKLRERATELTGANYNSCLLNRYQDGSEGMGWHADDEKSIVPGSSIASLSFGAERKFSLKHKRNKATVSVVLEDGSLLDMRGETQRHWVHQIPRSKKVTAPRVNLTFRSIRDPRSGGQE